MQELKQPDVIVAGHICLDLIPDLKAATLEALAVPGKLIQVGGAVTATGGTVANTGIALHKLGVPVQLMGKVGNDTFGSVILELLERYGLGLSGHMIIGSGEQSSYSIVISPRGADRIFLHCPGTNDTFAAGDVRDEALEHARLFHFGYPPLMRRMYADEGIELEKLLARVKGKGLTVSLDMALPDPGSEAGRADWHAILSRILPYVDLFLPSLEEIVYMLDGPERLRDLETVDGEYLAELTGRMLDMGTAIGAVKLGERGLYVRTTENMDRLRAMGGSMPNDLEDWTGRELLAPCFQVKVAGTTGAGDCTIAGFLCGLLRGSSIQEALIGAVGTGACNVEAVDATSGIVPWEDIWKRIHGGWLKHPVTIPLAGWRIDHVNGLWIGQHDRQQQ